MRTETNEAPAFAVTTNTKKINALINRLTYPAILGEEQKRYTNKVITAHNIEKTVAIKMAPSSDSFTLKINDKIIIVVIVATPRVFQPFLKLFLNLFATLLSELEFLRKKNGLIENKAEAAMNAQNPQRSSYPASAEA
ncbi:MAG: hypothetical protein CMN32_16050 [Saprospirales bacterium]|nr:hypothetical protein [Saprospirales bacterium]